MLKLEIVKFQYPHFCGNQGLALWCHNKEDGIFLACYITFNFTGTSTENWNTSTLPLIFKMRASKYVEKWLLTTLYRTVTNAFVLDSSLMRLPIVQQMALWQQPREVFIVFVECSSTTGTHQWCSAKSQSTGYFDRKHEGTRIWWRGKHEWQVAWCTIKSEAGRPRCRIHPLQSS